MRVFAGEVISLNKKRPYFVMGLLGVIVLGCLFAELIMPYDPTKMNLAEVNQAPSAAHFFGTDTMGRDIYSMIWYGGRISLFIGCLATFISTGIAVVYGCLAGLAGEWGDNLLMRFTDILMSVPQILLVIFIQAVFGEPTAISMAIVIGMTSWMAVSKMVRSEVRQIRNSEYILAARMMGGGFFYILRTHLAPNFLPSILLMVVTNLGSAIAMEATLSYLGIGLPTNIISWGSLMSLSQKVLLTGSWWLLLLPGLFLIVTLICFTELGEWKRTDHRRERLI